MWSFLCSAQGLYQLQATLAFWVTSACAWIGAFYHALHPADDA